MYVWEILFLNIIKKLDREIWPQLEFDKIRQRSRILVIDDDGFPYEELFRTERYTIFVWDDVKNVGELENGSFDIILLDINGIGKKISNTEGLGILEHIKKTNPMQMVIAMTNKTWGVDAATFFSLADERLNKSEDFIIYKQKIDQLLKKKFSKEYYIEKLNLELKTNGYNEKYIKKLFERSLMKGKIDYFISKIDILDEPKMKLIINIVNTAISIYTIINKFGG